MPRDSHMGVPVAGSRAGRFIRGLAAALLAAICLLAQAAPLSPVDQALAGAQASLAAGRYDEAYRQYLDIYNSEQNPLAASSLALFYHAGWGRPVDEVQACAWFLKAAEGKIPVAEHYAGDCLAEGTGMTADPAKAAFWYQRAADHGHYISRCSLGRLYIQGRGVGHDPRKGLALCSSAAQQGSVPAMLQTAQMLLGDDPALRNPAAAYSWYEQAAQLGSAEAQYQLGLMSRDGIGHAADAELARGWFEDAALQAYAPAYLPTAQLYFNSPADPQGGGPSPEILAKDYLWLQVATHCIADTAQLGQARAMLTQVLAIMPRTWAPALDEKLKGHLCEQPEPMAVDGKASS